MNKYDGLEIECGKPGKITTGLDTRYKLDGKNLKRKYKIRRFTWKMSPDGGLITITTRNGKRMTTKKKIKFMVIYTRYLTIISDNTSLGTQFYLNEDDENITKKLGAVSIDYTCSRGDKINKLELIIA